MTPPTPMADTHQLLAAAFPEPGRVLREAFRQVDLGVSGTAADKRALEKSGPVPRPWDPPTCRNPALREELWDWLEEVVAWLNSQYVWDVDGAIPACWPHHPDLVHEVAVIADKRRRAGAAYSSDGLEEWHRVCLPAFVERMGVRTGTHCEEGHQPWPAKGRYARYVGDRSAQDRRDAYRADEAAFSRVPQLMGT